MNQDESESLLVALVQHGDMAAFETLLRRLYRPLRTYIAAMVGDAFADDVLQEVSLRIYRHIRFLREPKAFRAWAYQIATRIAFVHLKREKQWRRVESDPDFQQTFPSVVMPLDESDAEFLSLVDQVSPASRAVLLLHFQQHLSLEEAAAILDIPLGTAGSVKHAEDALRDGPFLVISGDALTDIDLSAAAILDAARGLGLEGDGGSPEGRK